MTSLGVFGGAGGAACVGHQGEGGEDCWPAHRHLLCRSCKRAPMHIATLMLLGSGELGREVRHRRQAPRLRGHRVRPLRQCPRNAGRRCLRGLFNAGWRRAAGGGRSTGLIISSLRSRQSTRVLATLEAEELARRAFGQGGAADHEPRRHPRLRGEGGPDDLRLCLRDKPRGLLRQATASASPASSSR